MTKIPYSKIVFDENVFFNGLWTSKDFPLIFFRLPRSINSNWMIAPSIMVNIKHLWNHQWIFDSFAGHKKTKEIQSLRDPITKTENSNGTLKTLRFGGWLDTPTAHPLTFGEPGSLQNESFWVSPEHPPICWVKCWVNIFPAPFIPAPCFRWQIDGYIGAANLGSQKVPKKQGGRFVNLSELNIWLYLP